MRVKIYQYATVGMFLLLLFSLLFLGFCDYILPSRTAFYEGEALPSYPCIQYEETEIIKNDTYSTSTVNVKLFGLIKVKEIEVSRFENLELVPGGYPFGIKVMTGGICVSEYTPVNAGGNVFFPAKEAGLAVGDVIVMIDGEKIISTTALTEKVASSGGASMLLTVKRGNENINLTVKPQMDDIGVYRMGVKIKDSAGGLGTMTYIDPKTGAFGGLGHGICEITGKLTPITGGKVTDVDITGVKKGEVGTPGELCGILQHKKQGSLVSNTDSGVFGTLIEVPHIKPMPIALSHEVKTGKATIISTLANDAREEYDIEITAINRNGHIKSMMLKVTDPDLLSKTGGIVQGMSGSPIIQNGKIIGAVTHVLVNDPTAGYGIFIENMLKSMPEILQP